MDKDRSDATADSKERNGKPSPITRWSSQLMREPDGRLPASLAPYDNLSDWALASFRRKVFYGGGS